MSTADHRARRLAIVPILVAFATAALGVGALHAQGPDPNVGQQGTLAQNTPHLVAYPAPETPTQPQWPPGYPPTGPVATVAAGMPVGPTATQRSPGSYPISEGYTDARLVGINYSLHRWNEFLGLQLLTALLLVVGAALFGIRHRQAFVVKLRYAWSWARNNRYKLVLDLLILFLVMGSGVVFLAIIPVSAKSSLSGELIGVYTAVDEANYRIVCENGAVDELGMYFANTPDYGWLSGDDQLYISQAFGPDANVGAGLLTAKQAYYVWYFHAALHSTTTPAAYNPWAMRLAGGYCAKRPSPQPVQPHHVWINALGTVALVTHGDCGTLASLFRKINGRWKIVRIDEIQQCPELG